MQRNVQSSRATTEEKKCTVFKKQKRKVIRLKIIHL